MKIIYRDDSVQSFANSFTDHFSAFVEQRETIEEKVNRVLREKYIEIGGGGGAESLIDLGKYLIAFFVGSIASGASYDLFKHMVSETIPHLVENTKHHYDFFILSNGEDPDKHESNIYFFIPCNISDDKIRNALGVAKDIMLDLDKLKQHTLINGSLRFYFLNSQFILQEIK